MRGAAQAHVTPERRRNQSASKKRRKRKVAKEPRGVRFEFWRAKTPSPPRPPPRPRENLGRMRRETLWPLQPQRLARQLQCTSLILDLRSGTTTTLTLRPAGKLLCRSDRDHQVLTKEGKSKEAQGKQDAAWSPVSSWERSRAASTLRRRCAPWT